MRKIKLVKVYYEYDSYHEDSVVRSVLEGIPWTGVSEEKFKQLSEVVKNKHKVKELQGYTLWLIEDVASTPEATLSVDGMIDLYTKATEKERAAYQKRKEQEELRKKNKEALDLVKKKKLFEKLQKELGGSA